MSETTENPGTGESEARGLASVILWSQDCCAWQRDALRRLTIGELDEVDLAELIALCKKKSSKAVPLVAEHAPDSKAATLTVTLRRIEAVENVNALAEQQRLTFEKSGVTVIYGDNGSGKSGYIRVLKKVCRVRSSKDEKIVANIYASKTGPPKARIGFTVNGNNHDAQWENGKTGDSRLSSISIFDSSAASVHVDQTNNVAYTPFPMKVLEDLAQVCQVIKQRLIAEIEVIEKQTPAAIKIPGCRPLTAVGKLIAQLDGKTKSETVRVLATLSETENARLQTLKTDLVSDPAKTARTLSAQKVRLDNQMTALELLQASVMEGQAEVLTQLYRKYQTAKEASTAAAGNLFSNDPLSAIGSEAWRALWEAARAYSQQQAYPSAVFPFTADGARCVLCQQELDEEAAGRLVRFETFIKDESKRREQAARDIYEEAVQKLRAGNVSAANLRAIVAIVRDELNDTFLAAQVRKSTLTAKWRLRHILRAHGLSSAPPLPAGEVMPSQALAAYSVDLATRAAALTSESKSEDRKKLIAECDELADREWLSLVQEDVIAEISRRGEIAALQAALDDTKTNRITTKSAELAENLVTNALRAQFTKEVDKLGIAGLAIELRKDRSTYGTPLF
ncbi:MAG: AAA family ATPase, partial [Sciscionella sp.]